ncbi:hypothetical protein GTY75_09070 [Streptomyces sp. SID8381]|uniref:hypothetical protein n=1 Tax=unclassified Streptomyces TaxID=2593676 RepID=UPI00036B13B0|nr:MULTISPECIES: hypothetical protein [unclassified Streptomyces]MYX26818.1 hypothetical protein [Streptomyces sp. SID8381]
MTARPAPPAPFPATRVFHYQHAPVRVRLMDGRAVWFLRDLAAATGVRPAPGQPTVLPGIATTDEACRILAAAGLGDVAELRAWLDHAAGQLTESGVRRLQPVPRLCPRPADVRRYVA